MNVTSINIKIIDTNDNQLVNVDEATEANAPHLIYNGKDNKYATAVSSELNFNMWVNDAADGKFIHLFTGDETRYKVILEAYIDTGTQVEIVDLWQGFLLADHYSEPYKGGSFFVNFSATDGIGRIKNYFLPEDYYYEIQSFTSIIAECLKSTGSELPISIAPAIENAIVDFNYDKLDIDCSIFRNDKGVKKSAYYILNELLKTIGCTVLQWKSRWYIIGINRMHEIHLETENYDADGVYVDTSILYRANEIGNFLANPSIGVIPPLKTVTVDWETEEDYNMLPEDIVYQYPKVPGNIDYEVKYWKQYTIENNLAPEFTAHLTDLGYFGHPYQSFGAPALSPILESDQFYLSLTGYYDTATASNADYLELIEPIYVSGSYAVGEKINLKASGIIWFDESAVDAVDSGMFDDHLLYYVMIGDEILLSNSFAYDDFNVFDFKFSVGETIKQIKFELDIEDYPVNESGFLTVRLYPLLKPTTGSPPNLIRVTYTELQIEYNALKDKGSIEKIRGINYTKSEGIDVLIGSTENDKVENKLLINASVPFTSYNEVIDAEDVNVAINDYLYHTYSRYDFYNTQWYDVYETILYLSEEEYNYVSRYRDQLYIKRDATGTFEALTDFYLYKNDLRDYVLVSYEENTPILQDDLLYVRFTAETIEHTDRHYLLDTWKRKGIDENVTYLDALACIYHDVVKNPIKKIEGNLFGLYGPLDLLEFNYVNPANYQVARLDMNLAAGISQVNLLECLNQEVTDYE